MSEASVKTLNNNQDPERRYQNGEVSVLSDKNQPKGREMQDVQAIRSVRDAQDLRLFSGQNRRSVNFYYTG
jgi:hypothetical protein